MPWWVGVLAALVSWLVLYGLIRTPPPLSFPSDVVILPVLRGVAMGLQYLLPAVFLCGAVLSAWLRYKQYKNYADVAGEHGHVALELLTWREFEHLVGEFFRRKGFSVEQRGGRVRGDLRHLCRRGAAFRRGKPHRHRAHRR